MDFKSTVERLVEETREDKLAWGMLKVGLWRLSLVGGRFVVTVDSSGQIGLDSGDTVVVVDGDDDRKMVRESGLVELLEQMCRVENELQQKVESLNRCLDALQQDLGSDHAMDGLDLRVAARLLEAVRSGDLAPDGDGYVGLDDIISKVNLADIIDQDAFARVLGEWNVTPVHPDRREYDIAQLHDMLSATLAG